MRPLARAVLKTGLVSDESIQELRRWGLPVEVEDGSAEPLESIDQVVQVIRNALEGSEQVRIQESDVDILRRFLDPKFQRKGHLTVKDGTMKTGFGVMFCTTVMGEYVLPWKSEAIRDMMLMGESFLRFSEGEHDHTVHIADVRESYFGDHRAFMICTPEESHGD